MLAAFNLFVIISLMIWGLIIGALCQLFIPDARRVPNSTVFGIAMAGIVASIILSVILDFSDWWPFLVATVLAVSATYIGVEKAKQGGIL